MFEKMGNALKKKKQQIDNKIEGANTTINVVSKAVAVKNNVFEWISKNPEKPLASSQQWATCTKVICH